MEPRSEYPQSGYRAGDSGPMGRYSGPPDDSVLGYGPPPPQFAGSGGPMGPPAARPARGRPLISLLVMLVLELIVIAGYSNQYFYDKIRPHVFNGLSFPKLLGQASLTYTWRFDKPAGDDARVWLGHTIGVVAFIILSLLIAAIFLRAAVTFWRAFFGIFGTVVLTTVVSSYIGSIAVKPEAAGSDNSASGHLRTVFFFSVGSPAMFAAVVFGLVLGLLVATVAVLTRRPAILAPPAFAAEPRGPEPEQPPPFHGDPRADDSPTEAYRPQPGGVGGPGGAGSTPSGYIFDEPPPAPAPWAAGPGSDTPRRDSDEDNNSTRQFPVVDPPAGSSGPAEQAGSGSGSGSGSDDVSRASVASINESDATQAFARPSLSDHDTPAEPQSEPSAPEPAESDLSSQATHAFDLSRLRDLGSERPEPAAPAPSWPQPSDAAPAPEPPAASDPEPAAAPEPAPEPEAAAAPEPAPEPEPASDPEPTAEPAPAPDSEPDASDGNATRTVPVMGNPETTRFAEPPQPRSPARIDEDTPLD